MRRLGGWAAGLRHVVATWVAPAALAPTAGGRWAAPAVRAYAVQAKGRREPRAQRTNQRFEALKGSSAPTLYAKLMDQMASKGTPGKRELHLLLDGCQTPEDVAGAIEVMKRLRARRAQDLALEPYHTGTTIKLVEAGIRGGAVDTVLATLVHAQQQGIILTDELLKPLAAHNYTLDEVAVTRIVEEYHCLAVAGGAGSASLSVVLVALVKGGEAERAKAFAAAIATKGGATPFACAAALLQ